MTTVSAYSTTAPKNLSATKTALRRGLSEIKKAGLQLGLGRITLRKLPRENWADSWKRHFPPLEIGDALLVKPSWSKRRSRKGQAVIILDPGLGFAKQARHSYQALALLGRLAALGRPLLSGPSRKSFLKAALGDVPPAERDRGTAAAVTASVLAGAHIVRVHAVRGMAQVVRVADRVAAAAAGEAPDAV